MEALGPPGTCLVRVPSGLFEGDLFVVSEGGREHAVHVPKGLAGGSQVEVTLPVSQTVDVRLPPGCRAGDELMVELEDGTSLSFLVPEDVEHNALLTVDIPPGLEGECEWSSDGCSSGEWGSGEWGSDDWGCEWGSCEWDGGGRAAESEYSIGEEVDVLRSNGTRSRGTVDATDYASGTYTIRMEDGRIKHLVEEGDLLHYRAGAYHVRDAVRVRDGHGVCEARIESYDDEHNTYCVRYSDGRRLGKLGFVEEGEILPRVARR